MKRHAPLLLLLAAIVGLPFLLRPARERPAPGAETLVILTPHNETIRHEFEQGFRRHMRERYGREIALDWRVAGGTSEITRFLASEYLASFQNHWCHNLGRPWNIEVQAAFDNPRIEPAPLPASDSPAQAARRAFLESNVSCGIDLFFGGGSFDFSLQAAAGRLVAPGFLPALAAEAGIPDALGGEPLHDPHGRWIGTCLSTFGICYNTDVLARLGVTRPPARWDDLADPVYEGNIALTDPSKSGSAAKAFEMIVQQQMHATGDPARGWENAMHLLQRIAANARYFTDAGPKPALDVAAGDAAAGMTIDFFARFQSESIERATGSQRLRYVVPAGGSTVGADPIGLLRGAPHRELALEFIRYVLSSDGQKLWNWKVGSPGGPIKYALRRPPIRPDLYDPRFDALRSDPEFQPYRGGDYLDYRAEWTQPRFGALRFIIRIMCIDTASELKAAWRALIAAGMPPGALAAFHDVSHVSYEAAGGRIRDALRSPHRIEEVRLAKELGDRFRENYRRAARLAAEGQ